MEQLFPRRLPLFRPVPAAPLNTDRHIICRLNLGRTHTLHEEHEPFTLSARVTYMCHFIMSPKRGCLVHLIAFRQSDQGLGASRQDLET